MKFGTLIALPTCDQPDEVVMRSQRFFSTRNSLTLGKVYAIVGRDGSNVIVRDDEGREASFWQGSLRPTLCGEDAEMAGTLGTVIPQCLQEWREGRTNRLSLRTLAQAHRELGALLASNGVPLHTAPE